MGPTEELDDFLKIMSKLSEVLSGIEPKRKEIIQNLISEKRKSLPGKLYHYTNSNGIIGIIQTNVLWATDFLSLNDKTELVYGASLLVEELEQYGEEHNNDISVLLNKVSNFYKEHGDIYRSIFETYIISFSENTDMLSQWRAYSNNATGCCIEFDFTDSSLFTIVSESTPWALEVLPIIYDKAIQRKQVRSGIDLILNYLNSTEWTVKKIANSTETEQGTILGLLIHVFEPFVIAFKHPGFSEECEWRAVASCPSNLIVTKKKARIISTGSSNYLECLFIQSDNDNLWQRKLLPITGVKHGPLAKENVKEEIEKQLTLDGYESQVDYSDSSIPLK